MLPPLAGRCLVLVLALSCIYCNAVAIPPKIAPVELMNPNTTVKSSQEPPIVIQVPPDNDCPLGASMPPKSLLIAFVSAPEHFNARDSIRQAMSSALANIPLQYRQGITFKFFIGVVSTSNPECTTIRTRLYEEQSIYSDIARLDSFVENYSNLTRKTLGIITYAVENSYRLLLKVDDDTFLRVDNLLNFLRSERKPDDIYAGSFVFNNAVNTNPNSKWYDYDLFPYDTYPDYAAGPCYFLGLNVLNHIYAARKSLVLYRVEDAAVGIWTEDMLNVDRVNLNGHIYAAKCVDEPGIVFVNPANSNEILTLSRNTHRGNMCMTYSEKTRLSTEFKLHECEDKPCLCHPPPAECAANSWESFANESYKDQIPRLA